MSSTAGRPFAPDYATPPGETLAEWLDEQAMTHAEFAARAGMSTTEVGRIIHGTAVLGPDTVTRLEQATGIPARIWNALESYHRNHLARLEPPSAG
ncbi:MAG TPA: helix-turn-helix domain-containing protein [Mycobacteriales bacterium]